MVLSCINNSGYAVSGLKLARRQDHVTVHALLQQYMLCSTAPGHQDLVCISKHSIGPAVL
jgi:hypothetical protein